MRPTRRDEIEAKRARIAEIKRLREENRLRAESRHPQSSTQVSHSDRQSIDDLVDSLVGRSSRASNASHTSHTSHNSSNGEQSSNTPRNASSLSNHDITSPSPAVNYSPRSSVSHGSPYPVSSIPLPTQHLSQSQSQSQSQSPVPVPVASESASQSQIPSQPPTPVTSTQPQHTIPSQQPAQTQTNTQGTSTNQTYTNHENEDSSGFESASPLNVESSVLPTSSPNNSSNSNTTITYSKEVQTNESWLQTTKAARTGTSSSSYTETDLDTGSDINIERLRASIRAEIEEEYRIKDLHIQETQEDGATTLLYEPEKNNLNQCNANASTTSQNTKNGFGFEGIEIEIPVSDTKNENSGSGDGLEGIDAFNNKHETDSLAKFMSQSLKVVNRALDSSFYDITVDYAEYGDSLSNSQLKNNTNTNNSHLIQIAQFYSQNGSKGRAITDLDWHTKFPELLASAHTEKRGDPHASKGIVQVWNLHSSSSQNSSSSSHNTPEYLFKSPSDVLSAKFSLFSPTILFGTCYNGQVLTWDFRAGQHPVLSSPLNGTGHSHPIYALELTGTQHAQNVVTASTDGAVCTWTPDILESPQDRLVLSGQTAASASAAAVAALSSFYASNPGSSIYSSLASSNSHSNTYTPSSSLSHRNDEIAPTRLAISHRDPSRFVIGTEEGTIYQCTKFGGAGSRAGIDPRGAYKGHEAPVTSLSFHSSKGVKDLGDLVLSGGLDWAIKLWRVRPFSGPLGGHGGSSNNNTYGNLSNTSSGLHFDDELGLSSGSSSSIHRNSNNLLPILDIPRDYEVYDVAWSNSYPSVFGSVDGSGHLEVWDLLVDTEAPVCRVKPSVFKEGHQNQQNSSSSSSGSLSSQQSKPGHASKLSMSKHGGNRGSVGGGIADTLGSAEDYLSRPLNKLAWSKHASPYSEESIFHKLNSKSPSSHASHSNNINVKSEGVDENDDGTDGNAAGKNKKQGLENKTRLAVGGLDGVVSVFELQAEKFAEPEAAHWRRMEELLSDVDVY